MMRVFKIESKKQKSRQSGINVRTMENLFDVIGNRMFSVFASKDRRANYELLLFIYDTFTGRDL